ncbi:MAG: flagellar hook-associated protein FlgK [Desulfobulbaceae bacterium]|nr:flagellar hook-associated protein FlgK [Desulfobulbaceae bacterium]
MAGIASVLNIAKEALLAHQLSMQVASHNVANVDTPGYTRQTLSLTPSLATPVAVGNIGNGVHGDQITRQYDQFMTQRIINQTSTNSNLEAQESALRVVGTIFNEAPGMALNDLMSQFWDSWQKLADNPEIVASRQQVVQQGQLLFDHLQNMNSEVTQGRYDIGVSLDAAVTDVNSLTSEIANLNIQISNTESENHQANDLRDQRDELTKELAGFLDINYFEDANTGGYSIMMADGHSLVDTGTSWKVQWGNNQLYVLDTNNDGKTIRSSVGDGLELGGKIGGWLEVRGELMEGDPTNYLGRLDALANAMIREVNQIHSQGVGLTPFSEAITGAERADNTGVLTTVVDPTTAHETLEAGLLTINGREIGQIDGVSAASTGGLAMGKAYYSAKAINDAIVGVNAKLTTLVAGNAVSGGTLGGLDATEAVSFTVNGITVNYTAGATDETAAETAANVVAAINTAINAYNADPDNAIDMTIEAVVGDGTNGGADNSIVLFNTNAGDESRIIIDGAEDNAIENKLGLTNDTYIADKTHNTGTLTMFSTAIMTIDGGNDDMFLDHLGLGGAMSTTTYATSTVSALVAPDTADFKINLNDVTIPVSFGAAPLSEEEVATQITNAINAYTNTTGVEALIGNGLNGGDQNAIVFRNALPGDTSSITLTAYTQLGTVNVVDPAQMEASVVGGGLSDDAPNDGEVIYDPAQHGFITASLQGLDYADELQLDGNSFGIWVYDAEGSTVLPQPVTVDLERATTLDDVAAAINSALKKEGVDSFIAASVQENRLRFTNDDAGHQFAFTSDSTNILQATGINTFLTGHSAGSFGVNDLMANNLDYIAAGKITDTGKIFRGDNSNALEMNSIQQDEYVRFTGGSTNTLDDFYNALVAEIGTRGRTVERNIEYSNIVMNQMNEMRDSQSGVSLDEEMANLIKFQHAYSAAAKLISASDEMYKTLLSAMGIG